MAQASLVNVPVDLIGEAGPTMLDDMKALSWALQHGTVEEVKAPD